MAALSALLVVALPACSGGGPDDALESGRDGLGMREASARELAGAERSRTVAYVEVERATPIPNAVPAANAVSAANAVPASGPELDASSFTLSVGSAEEPIAEGVLSTSSQALAHFAETRDPSGTVMEAAGLVRRLPEVREPAACGVVTRAPDAAESPSAGRSFELLDAGVVRLIPEGQPAVTLAPRAFPGLSAFASGVVYTNRERSASLPSALEYRVEVNGGRQVAPMVLRATAPHELSNVTVDGLPLAQVHGLDSGRPHDLTWDVGSAGDLVYLDLTLEGTGRLVRCAYPDEAGAGSLPSSALAGFSGSGLLSVHRFRRVLSVPEEMARGPELDPRAVLPERAEVRFDFELNRRVQLGAEQRPTQPGERAGGAAEVMGELAIE